MGLRFFWSAACASCIAFDSDTRCRPPALAAAMKPTIMLLAPPLGWHSVVTFSCRVSPRSTTVRPL